MPTDQPLSRASPMQGGGSYNRNAVAQAAGAVSAVPALVSAAHRVPLGTDPAALVVADYGSAQGRNSLAPMHAAIATLRDRIGPARPICVVHTDQPANDFTTLFQLLDADPESYLADAPNVFPAAIGRSFYQGLFPPGSVTLGWCSNAAHWLSRVPVPVPDAWHYANSRLPGVVSAFQHQAAEDWQVFLAHRGQELRPGGRLVVLAMTLDEGGELPWKPYRRHLHDVRRELLDTGRLAPELCVRIVLPTAIRSREEYLAPFQAAGSFAGLIVEHFRAYPTPDPIWDEFEASGNREAFGQRWAALIGATLGPSLASPLAPDEAVRFLSLLSAGLASRFASDPQPMGMWNACIVLAKEGD